MSIVIAIIINNNTNTNNVSNVFIAAFVIFILCIFIPQ